MKALSFDFPIPGQDRETHHYRYIDTIEPHSPYLLIILDEDSITI